MVRLEDLAGPAREPDDPRIETDMPPNLPMINPLAIFVILCILAAIVSTWIMAILRLALRLPLLPSNTPRVVPWGPGSVVTSIVAYFVIQVVVVVIYGKLVTAPGAAPGPDGSPFTPFEMMGLSAAFNLATLVVVPLVLLVTSGAGPRDLGLREPGPLRQFALGVLAYPILAPLVFGVMLLSLRIWKGDPHPLAKALADQMSPARALLMVLAGVVLAPLAEELMFRGVLLGWLNRLILRRGQARTPSGSVEEGFAVEVMDVEGQPDFSPETPRFEPGPSLANPYAAPTTSIAEYLPDPAPVAPPDRALPLFLANVAVSLIFAGMHYKVWPTPMPIFFLSLGLGFLYQRTGGLIAPVALHMTLNGVSTLIMFLTLAGSAPKPPDVPIPPLEPPKIAIPDPAH
jgi:membrane protease YdiL (CAAX protease family)